MTKLDLSSFYWLFSGLGLFYFGLRVLSNRQQQLMGKWLHRLLMGISDESFAGFHRGLLFSIISGSTNHAASTFMGLVNSGLLSLKGSMKLIIGALVGGPMLALILALVPHSLGPMLMSFGLLPFLVNSPEKGKLIGGMAFGLGMMVWGLSLMALGFTAFGTETLLPGHPVFQIVIGFLIAWPFGRWLKTNLVGMGLILAISDVMHLPILFLMSFVFSLLFSLAMQVRSLAKEGTLEAKRSANFILLFTLGVGIFCIGLGALVLWQPQFQKYIVLSFASPSLLEAFLALIPFSFCAGFFLLASKPIFNSLQTWPKGDGIQDEHELEVLGESRDMIPALSLLQARLHLAKLREIVRRLFVLVQDYVHNAELDARVLAKVKDYERVSDNMREEMDDFMVRLMENPLSQSEAHHVRLYSIIADQLEDISDLIDKMATYNTRHRPMEHLDGDHRKEFMDFFEEVLQFFLVITKPLDIRQNALEDDLVSGKALSLKAQAEGMREMHLERMAKSSYPPFILMTYSDMVVCLRKIRGHTLKIFNAINHLEKH